MVVRISFSVPRLVARKWCALGVGLRLSISIRTSIIFNETLLVLAIPSISITPGISSRTVARRVAAIEWYLIVLSKWRYVFCVRRVKGEER